MNRKIDQQGASSLLNVYTKKMTSYIVCLKQEDEGEGGWP
jgi:hypothetical protein